MSKRKNLALRIVLFTAIMAAIIIGMRMVNDIGQSSEKYDSLAQCLAQKQVKFYGAFWCVHCQEQKHEFAAAAKDLPYVECSTPDGKAVNKVCTDAGITGYPTWVFPDGSRLESVESPETLAAKSGCSITSPSPSSGGTAASE